jgi:3-deoxy-D-manno-octulosonic-acid transferase
MVMKKMNQKVTAHYHKYKQTAKKIYSSIALIVLENDSENEQLLNIFTEKR